MKVWTIGYQGRTLDSFIETLIGAHVRRVVDVRAVALSRKKGFSKTALRTGLTAAGIEYLHLRVAGNPYRDLKQDIKTCLALYAKHVDTTPAVMNAVVDAVRGASSALLCFEHNACECHRSVLVERLTGCEIAHM